ncbi:MAG: DUF1573 domain-containing protein [Chthoniobacteraceae bacterium]
MLRLLLLALLCCAPPALAQLQWEKPWQEFHRPPEDDYLETKFNFRNAGTSPVTIKSVKTSCGCTTAHLEKKTFSPGEKGEIVTRFTFGQRTGGHRKLITVTTADGARQELNLVVFIHPALTVSPALVFWKVGQPAEAQMVHLAAEPGTTVRVKSVTSSNPRLSATLKAIKAGEHYALSVKPADTTQRESAELTVETDYPSDAPRAFTIHARIK